LAGRLTERELNIWPAELRVAQQQVEDYFGEHPIIEHDRDDNLWIDGDAPIGQLNVTKFVKDEIEAAFDELRENDSKGLLDDEPQGDTPRQHILDRVCGNLDVYLKDNTDLDDNDRKIAVANLRQGLEQRLTGSKELKQLQECRTQAIELRDALVKDGKRV